MPRRDEEKEALQEALLEAREGTEEELWNITKRKRYTAGAASNEAG